MAHPRNARHTLWTYATVALTLAYFPASSAHSAPLFPNPVFGVGSNPAAMVRADFDGDGIADLMVSNSGTNEPPGDISYLRGRTDGTFASEVRIPLSRDPGSIFSADFNGDGRPDLALEFFVSGVILLNQGQGVFGAEQPLPVALTNFRLRMGDFNGDGRKDFLAYGPQSGGPSFQVLFGNGDGTFTAGLIVPVPTANLEYLTVAEFTSDGRDDVIATTQESFNAPNHVVVFASVGDGTFAPPKSFQSDDYVTILFPADLNGDGRTDFLSGSAHFHQIIYFGRGDGTFDLGPTGPPMFTLAMTSGDMNGDGILDYLTSSYSFEIQVHLGSAGGTYTHLPVFFAGQGNFALSLADTQGDGILDLAVVVSESEAVFTYAGNGDGTFGPPPIPGLANASIGGVVALDFNGDGKLDLAAARGDIDFISILPGNGDGTFGQEIDYPGATHHVAMAAADFDHDGHEDLVAVAQGWASIPPDPLPPGSLIVLKGNGDGTFGAPQAHDTGKNPMGLAVADFNLDGNQDVAVVDFGDPSAMTSDFQLFLGVGDGTLSALAPIALPYFPQDIAVGDFNADARPDLVITLRNDAGDFGEAVIYFGNGNGTFSAPAAVLQVANATSVGVADLNGDGDQDLVVADGAGQTRDNPGAVTVLLGSRHGTFTPKATFRSGIGPYDINLMDFDGNGTVDLAVGNNSQDVSFFWGRGDGTFSAEARYAALGSPSLFVGGDFTSDSQADFLEVSSGGAFIFRNKTLPPTNVLNPTVTRFISSGMDALVSWSTDREADITGFDIVTSSRSGLVDSIAGGPIACFECTTSLGHHYSVPIPKLSPGKRIYIEVIYRDLHTVLFGPAQIISVHPRQPPPPPAPPKKKPHPR